VRSTIAAARACNDLSSVVSTITRRSRAGGIGELIEDVIERVSLASDFGVFSPARTTILPIREEDAAASSSGVMRPARSICASTSRPRVVAALGPQRGIFGRSFQESGDDGRFGERQLLCRLAKVAMRRGVDAVGAAAEIDAVQIELEDVGLRKPCLEPDGERSSSSLPQPCGRR